MDPALGSKRGSDLDPCPPAAGDFNLVVGLELANLGATDLIRNVRQCDQIVADQASLEAARRGRGEGQGR